MLVIHNNLLTDAQQWSLNPPLMLRHFSTSGDLWCVHTSIVVHRPTSFDIARCRPSSLSDATATRLGIAGHRSKSIVDQCTAMKSERIIMVRSGQTSIVLHWPTSVDSSLLWDYPRFVHIVAVASLSDEGRHRAMSKGVGRCTTMEVWTHHKSPLVLKWRNINGAFRLHCCASVSEYLCMQRGWPRAKGRVGKCRLMQSNRRLNAQHYI